MIDGDLFQHTVRIHGVTAFILKPSHVQHDCETPVLRAISSLSVSLMLLFGSGLTAYGESFVFVSLLQERKIVTFHRNIESGELEHRHVTDCPAEPAFTAASSDGRFLFVSLRSSGQLAAFRIDPANGQLSLINVVDGGDDPAFLITDRSEKFLLTAYYVSNKVTVHSVASNGRLSEASVLSVATADNAHGIAIDSKNQAVYVSHTGANRIDHSRHNAATEVFLGVLNENCVGIGVSIARKFIRTVLEHFEDVRPALNCPPLGAEFRVGTVALYSASPITRDRMLRRF